MTPKKRLERFYDLSRVHHHIVRKFYFELKTTIDVFDIFFIWTDTLCSLGK
jgi:hypothetical protein